MRIFLLLFLVVSSFAAQTDTETAVTQGKVNVTDHFIFSNAQSANPTAPRENSLLHEDRVRGEYGPLNAGVSFANTYAQDVPNFTNQPFLLEKVHAEMDTEHWRVTVGD